MITRKYFNEEAMFWIHTFTLKLCRIQGFMDQDPDPDILENVTHESSYYFYGSCSTFILRTPSRITKLQEKPPALQIEHLALQNMKLLHFYGTVLPGSGSADPSDSASGTSKHWHQLPPLPYRNCMYRL
jgi:hypothetical protein